MIQLEAENGTLENEEIAAGAIMSAGVGIAGALTTALWGGFGRNNGYYFAMIITVTGAITILQAVLDNIFGGQHVSFLRAAS